MLDQHHILVIVAVHGLQRGCGGADAPEQHPQSCIAGLKQE